MPLSSGDRLGRYEILEPLGAGGMGEVYRAKDIELERHVAIKVLPEQPAQDSGRIARFEREAKAIAKLAHPNILEIWDFGREGDVTYAVTELLEGETLRERLKGGRLGWRKAAEIGATICDGLSTAHHAGIVHRDIKPSNIFITSDGRTKILDFGLARPQAAEAGSRKSQVPTMSQPSGPGTVVGTVGYMSPEQVRTDPLDGRSDIFSLGCVLYEMVSGTRAFARDTAVETMASILKEEPREISSIDATVPPGLERAIYRCLEKNPDSRFQSARDLAFTLRSISSDAPRVVGQVTTVPSKSSIAVLPFANMSADPEQEFFCDGMAEEIINALTKIEDIRVVARTSAFSFKGKDVDIREIGRKLSASRILTGSLRKSGSRLRIAAQLINVEDGYHIWSERFDRNMEDVFDIQDEISRAVVNILKIKLSETDKAALARQPTEDLEAYNLYLKGRFYINQLGEEGYNKALDCFNKAIDKEPSFALAHAGIAESYVFQCIGVGIQPPKDSIQRAREAALRAVELNPALAEAHASLANVATYFDWDRAVAGRSFKQATELNPNSADILMWCATYLLVLEHEFEEAIGMLARALELNPLHFMIYSFLGSAYACISQFDNIIEEANNALSLDPGYAYGPHLLGEAYLGKGLYGDAIAHYEEAIRRMGRSTTNIAELGFAHALAGNTSKAKDLLCEVEERAHRSNMYYGWLALVHVGLGENDRAFEWFEKACETHDGIFLWLAAIEWPKLTEFRKDPRFKDLLTRAGLAHLVQ